MNRLDWAQIALSLGVMLIGFYIALFRRPGRGVLATTRVASLGVALLGLRYFAGGLRVPPWRVHCSIGSNLTRRWWESWSYLGHWSGRRVAGNDGT